MKQEEERKAKASAYMREYRRVKRQMEPEERCPRKAKHDPCWSREEANEGRQRLQQQARPIKKEDQEVITIFDSEEEDENLDLSEFKEESRESAKDKARLCIYVCQEDLPTTSKEEGFSRITNEVNREFIADSMKKVADCQNPFTIQLRRENFSTSLGASPTPFTYSHNKIRPPTNNTTAALFINCQDMKEELLIAPSNRRVGHQPLNERAASLVARLPTLERPLNSPRILSEMITTHAQLHLEEQWPGPLGGWGAAIRTAHSLEESYVELPLAKTQALARMQVLKPQLDTLDKRRKQKQLEIAGIRNPLLRERYQNILGNLMKELVDKQQEYEDLINYLQQYRC